MAELRWSAWERARAEALGPAWASGLLGMTVDLRAQACASAASQALAGELAVPVHVPEEISEAIDVLRFDTIRVDVRPEWCLEVLA